jgi:hypothetical protein
VSCVERGVGTGVQLVYRQLGLVRVVSIRVKQILDLAVEELSIEFELEWDENGGDGDERTGQLEIE